MEKQILKLTVTEFVSVNHYLAYRVATKGGRSMAMSYKTKEAKDFQKSFEKYIVEQVKEQGWVTDPNPMQHYYVDITVYFPRLDMDINNYHKVSFDSITNTGLVWVDDNVVCERVKHIYYDSKNPRIEYEIYKTDYIGIFDDCDQMSCFEEKCKTCKRYKRNCSILKKAKEGRIQEEICDLKCCKYNSIS